MAFLAALILAGCKSSRKVVYQGEGKVVAAGPAREVIVAPNGSAVGWLAAPDLARDKGFNASDHLYIGTATFSAMGAPVTLGRGVTTLPGAFFFSPSGAQVGAITEWSFKRQTGALVIGDVDRSSARQVGKQVSFFGFSPDGGLLGFVDENSLMVGPADGSAPPSKVAEEIATFEFAPDGESLIARRRALGGGQLVYVALSEGAEPRVIGERVADYRWAPDGSGIAFTSRNDRSTTDLFVTTPDGKARQVGQGVPTFRFSGDGKHLAFIGDISHTKQFGDLFLLAQGSEKAAKLGEGVTEMGFDPTGARIGWLNRYSAQSRGGTLTWAFTSGKHEPHEVGPNVPSFIWSHDGRHLAYVQRQLEEIFSIDLFLASADDEAGGEGAVTKVAQGVFGYSFSGDDRRLFMRTECTRNGRACTLRAVDVEKPADSATTIARAIHTYEPANEDESILLVTYARTDADALDLAVVPADGSQKPRMLDQRVLAGTRVLRDKDPKIAYAVLEPGRLGVYLADVSTGGGEATE